MHGRMNQYKRVWNSPITLQNKVEKMGTLVWSKGRWSLHLLHLTKHLRQALDSAQARYLRRLAKIPHAYISRISHKQVRRTCKCKRRFSTDILKAQLRWLGHILRRPPEHPLRLVLFEPGPNLRPRLSGTTYKKKVGRPREDWAQSLLGRLCTFTSKTRAEILTLVQDKRIYHRYVERLCSHVDRL